MDTRGRFSGRSGSRKRIRIDPPARGIVKASNHAQGTVSAKIIPAHRAGQVFGTLSQRSFALGRGGECRELNGPIASWQSANGTASQACGNIADRIVCDSEGKVAHSELRFGNGLIYVGSEWADYTASPRRSAARTPSQFDVWPDGTSPARTPKRRVDLKSKDGLERDGRNAFDWASRGTLRILYRGSRGADRLNRLTVAKATRYAIA